MNQNSTQTVTNNGSNTITVQANETAPDIVTRVSAFNSEANPQNGTKPDAAQEAISFNVKDFEKIQDPVARKLAEDAYKSMQADYTRKTQDLASRRKELDSLKAQLEQSGNFTPAKIQELLNNPTFVQAAQEYERSLRQSNQNGSAPGDLTEEELSYLPEEQKKLYFKQKQMYEQNQAMLANLQKELVSAQIQKEDSELSGRYKNYDANVINDVYKKMMTGEMRATREHLFKAIDYDEAVKRAYQLGRQDEKTGIAEKVGASSLGSSTNTQTMQGEAPLKEKNESFSDYWKRLAGAAKARTGQN